MERMPVRTIRRGLEEIRHITPHSQIFIDLTNRSAFLDGDHRIMESPREVLQHVSSLMERK